MKFCAKFERLAIHEHHAHGRYQVIKKERNSIGQGPSAEDFPGKCWALARRSLCGSEISKKFLGSFGSREPNLERFWRLPNGDLNLYWHEVGRHNGEARQIENLNADGVKKALVSPTSFFDDENNGFAQIFLGTSSVLLSGFQAHGRNDYNDASFLKVVTGKSLVSHGIQDTHPKLQLVAVTENSALSLFKHFLAAGLASGT
ncbi:hypothetical protein C8R45DRAFT_1120729 [Mycena sanguinolenta]|nr:hypothetical protein C8R45DRAFT_1120729 [Mycena sanguinolenta]